MKKHPLTTPISLDNAVAFTSNWRSFNTTNYLNSYELAQYYANAFTFDLQDVQDVLAETGCNKVRIYFGFDTNEPTALGETDMRLMMCGVDSEGNDIIHNSSTNSGVYDFAVPCPTTCDYNSPLVTGIVPPPGKEK